MPHAIRVPPRPGEPAYEAFERLAARLGDADGDRLARSLGIDRKALRHGVGVDRVGELLGLDARSLTDATFVREARGMRLGGFVVPFRGWAPSKRVCVRCLVQDSGDEDDGATLWKYRRTWWDLRAVDRCERHGCALLDACPGCGSPLAWRDRPPRLCASCGRDLLAASGASAPDAGWEAYLVGRLGFGPARPAAILDAMPLTDALSCVLAVGETLSPRSASRSSPKVDRARAALGFGLLGDGGRALRAGLLALEPPSPHLDGRRLRRLLNPLLGWLEAHPGDATGPIRDALLSHVRSAWVVTREFSLLGEPLSPDGQEHRLALGRRLGLDPTILDRLLRHAGLAAAGERECGAGEFARLRETVDASVTVPEARRILDLDTRTLMALAGMGILPWAPWTEGESTRGRFVRCALVRLAAALRFDVPMVGRRTADQMTFDDASRALRRGSRHHDRARAISHLLSGRIRPCARLDRGRGPTTLLFDGRTIEVLQDADAQPPDH
ncbi:hypothetical protein AU375_02584 [Methylobacterium radiotolerans]|nr:hypothetical protein AU375_02584 [Methylobacterium radiotolerans]